MFYTQYYDIACEINDYLEFDSHVFPWKNNITSLKKIYIMGMIEIGPRDELKKIYNKPANRNLKYCSIAAISVVLALLLTMLIFIEQLSYRTILLMKGFSGLFAIIFAVLYGILIYRVNREYIDRKR